MASRDGELRPARHGLPATLTRSSNDSESRTQQGGNLNTSAGRSGNLILYQPADRFWTFQSTEAGLFVLLAAAALGIAIWLLHRRSG
jgi:hypothetical protein